MKVRDRCHLIRDGFIHWEIMFEESESESERERVGCFDDKVSIHCIGVSDRVEQRFERD